MRIWTRLAAMAGALIMTFSAGGPAEASHWGDRHGWAGERVVRHHGYYPHYQHRYYGDPYAYQYSPRRYYPYYNSGYWRSAAEMRYRPRYFPGSPPYYAAWGYPKKCDRHGVWHKHHYRHTRRHHR